MRRFSPFSPRTAKTFARRSIRVRPSIEVLESRRLLACDTFLWNQHVDIEVEYEEGALTLVIYDGDSGETCNPEETILYVGANVRTPVPVGWDFLGATGTYWRLAQIRTDPDSLAIGGAAEELDPDDFDAYRPADTRVTARAEWVKFTLRELYAPGHVSVWRDGQAPNQWWISSFDGGRTYEPTFYVAAGAHVDFNWGFSAPGYYVVGLEASAFQGGSGLPIRSALTYYYFYVDDGGVGPGGAPRAGDAGVVTALTATATSVTVSPLLVAPAPPEGIEPLPQDALYAVSPTGHEAGLATPSPIAQEQADELFAEGLFC